MYGRGFRGGLVWVPLGVQIREEWGSGGSGPVGQPAATVLVYNLRKEEGWSCGRCPPAAVYTRGRCQTEQQQCQRPRGSHQGCPSRPSTQLNAPIPATNVVITFNIQQPLHQSLPLHWVWPHPLTLSLIPVWCYPACLLYPTLTSRPHDIQIRT